MLLVLPLVIAACGGTEPADEAASDVATLETTAPETLNAEVAAEPTTTTEPASDGAAAKTADGGESSADGGGDAGDAANDDGDAGDAGTAEEEPAEADPLSEDDAQDILNDFSGCMRGEGLDTFPDMVIGNGARQIMDAGIDPFADEFREAFEACGDGLDQLQSNQPELSPEEQLTAEAALLAGAECMRESGYENFPDPDFSQGYGQQAYLPGLLSSGIDMMSSEFQAAGAECSRRITDEYNLEDN